MDPLAPSTYAPAAGVAESGGVACAAMATTWKTLKVESGDLKALMIVRTLPGGSIHVSVDPFHDYVRPKMPLGRWLSEIRVGSDLGQWWLRFSFSFGS